VIKKLLAACAVVALVVGVLVLALGCGGSGSSTLSNDALAKVGSVQITQAQYDKRLAAFEKQLGTRVPDKTTQPYEYKVFQQQVLEYMVTLEIAKQKMAGLDVAVTDYDIQTQIDQIKAMFSGDEAAFASALQQQNLTLDDLTSNLREQSIINGVVNVVTKDATVTTADAQAYYDAHVNDFTVAETRQTRHILFAPKNTADPSATPTQADWDAAKALAEKVRQQIVDGADFAAMAKQYSDDPGSKDSGGDLGGIKKDGSTVAEFEAAVFALKQGELSQPVKTQYGYHLIDVTQIDPARTQTFAEVKDTIINGDSSGTFAGLLSERKQALWNAWMTKIRTELGVVYKDGWVPATTTTTAGATTTTAK
jgi:parvulin-like peptidyl-prolyl isomerase